METQQETLARVVRAEEAWIWVEPVAQHGCDSCGAKGACGTSVLAGLFSARHAPIKLPNTLAAQVGDQVVLTLSERALLRQSLWAYGVPLVGFFAGALVGQELGSTDLYVLLGAVSGMAAGWWLTARFAQIEHPRVSKIVKGGLHETTTD